MRVTYQKKVPAIRRVFRLGGKCPLRILRRAALFLLLALLCGNFLALPLSAVGEDVLPDFAEALPSPVEEVLRDYLTPEGARELIGAEYVASMLFRVLSDGLSGVGGFLLRLLGITLLFALLSHLSESFGGKTAAEAAITGMTVILTAYLLTPVSADMERTIGALGDMRSFGNGLIPVFGGLYAMGGSSATAVASASGFMSFSYLLEQLVTLLLPQVLRLLMIFTMISSVREQQTLGGVFRSIRGLYVSVLGFASLLLVTSIGFQSTLTAATDNLATTSVRFAVGNLIPIIGGSLGGTLRTVNATLSLLKGTVGTLSVVALLLLLLPPLVSMLLHRFALSLAASASDILGSPRGARIFREFCGIYDLAIATLAIGSVLFLLILGIFAKCGMALGGMAV